MLTPRGLGPLEDVLGALVQAVEHQGLLAGLGRGEIVGHGFGGTGRGYVLPVGACGVSHGSQRWSNDGFRLTGALGLIMTVGGRGPSLAGVLPPLAPWGWPTTPPPPNLSGAAPAGPSWAWAASAG